MRQAIGFAAVAAWSAATIEALMLGLAPALLAALMATISFAGFLALLRDE